MTNNKITLGICLGLGLITLLVFAAMYQKKELQKEPISATDFQLNTVIKVDIYDSNDETLLDEVFALCEKYEKLFSRTLESSEIYQLNHGTLPKEDGAFLLSEETADIISRGLDFGRHSGGAFDITIAPVSSLWDFTSGENIIPAQAELDQALPLVNYENVKLEGRRLTFAKEGMGIDLGAIAKGYIADKMKEYLVSKGVKSATINLGGNVLCIGNRPDGTPFRIGIQKPFANRSETIAVMKISDQSVVSSGIYERYFEKDGVLYHHILNPKTGMPYENQLVSVTIISDASVDGDGLSTSCFALGLEKGMELINSLPGVQAVFITDDYKLHYSDGFLDEIELVSLEE